MLYSPLQVRIVLWPLKTAFTVKCLRTSWNCANQSQVSHHGNISDLAPASDSSWSYHATDSAFMADRLSVWLAHRSGILCRTACGIRLLARTVSDNLWRRFCLQCTDAFSALEVSRRCATKSTFYLLTYLLPRVPTSIMCIRGCGESCRNTFIRNSEACEGHRMSSMSCGYEQTDTLHFKVG